MFPLQGAWVLSLVKKQILLTTQHGPPKLHILSKLNSPPPPRNIVWPSLVILMLYVFRIQFSVANVITTVISLVLACGQSSGEREYGVHNLHSDVHTYTHKRVHIYLSWLKLWNFSFTFSLILWSSFFHTNNPCASGHIGW